MVNQKFKIPQESCSIQRQYLYSFLYVNIFLSITTENIWLVICTCQHLADQLAIRPDTPTFGSD